MVHLDRQTDVGEVDIVLHGTTEPSFLQNGLLRLYSPDYPSLQLLQLPSLEQSCIKCFWHMPSLLLSDYVTVLDDCRIRSLLSEDVLTCMCVLCRKQKNRHQRKLHAQKYLRTTIMTTAHTGSCVHNGNNQGS